MYGAAMRIRAAEDRRRPDSSFTFGERNSDMTTPPRPRNPFRPTFGVSPHVLAGRDRLLADFELALAEGPGSPYRAILVSGARGIGKTVLLNELEDVARGLGWVIA